MFFKKVVFFMKLYLTVFELLLSFGLQIEFTDLSILEPVFQEDGILPFLNGLVFALHRGLKIQISP